MMKLMAKVSLFNGKALKVLVSLATLTLASAAQAELVIQNTPSNVAILPSSMITSPTMTAPTDASITRLMTVLHIDDMIDGVIAQQQQVATAVQNMPNQLPSSDKQSSDKQSIFSRKVQQQLQKIFTQYSQVFGQQIDPVKRREELTTTYKNAAKQHYTQAEVDALVSFYDTPMGQQILRKQSQVSMDFLRTALPTMAGDSKSLENILPLLQKDIEKIFN